MLWVFIRNKFYKIKFLIKLYWYERRVLYNSNTIFAKSDDLPSSLIVIIIITQSLNLTITVIENKRLNLDKYWNNNNHNKLVTNSFFLVL